jgi:hypothetical protein
VAQIFHPSTNTISKPSIFGSVVLLVSLVAALATINESPYITEVGVARGQPVPFSHKHTSETKELIAAIVTPLWKKALSPAFLRPRPA